jgi:hypothetical protein
MNHFHVSDPSGRRRQGKAQGQTGARYNGGAYSAIAQSRLRILANLAGKASGEQDQAALRQMRRMRIGSQSESI